MYVCCTMCAMYNVHVYLCEAAGEVAINFYVSCVYQLRDGGGGSLLSTLREASRVRHSSLIVTLSPII